VFRSWDHDRVAVGVGPSGFDIGELFAALDRERSARHLSWAGVARELWAQSEVLNALRDDHPISSTTISNMGARGGISCQHALFMLRWLGRPPEDFIARPASGTADVALPSAGPEQRLRWSLNGLYNALNVARSERGASWQQTATRLHCTPSQLTGLRTAKFATSMRLAMRICQTLHTPSAQFIYPADW
jgi:hypothetical protein